MSDDTRSSSFLALEPPRPERCAAPVHVDARGQRVADAHALLGLEPGADADAVRRAWVEKIQEHPPEKDPEGARRLREARDRLTEPARLFERLLGTLHVPDAAAWGLATDSTAAPGAPASQESPPEGETQLDAKSRILGQALVYTLVEDTFVKAQSR